MYEVEVEVSFDAAHRLLTYEGKCFNLHGHRPIVVVTLRSLDLNAQGFVIDFGIIKTFVKGWIDEHWDHTALLNRKDPLVPLLEGHGCKMYCMEGDPTAENIARTLYYVVQGWLLDNKKVADRIYVYSVSVKETPTSVATYRES